MVDKPTKSEDEYFAREDAETFVRREVEWIRRSPAAVHFRLSAASILKAQRVKLRGVIVSISGF